MCAVKNYYKSNTGTTENVKNNQYIMSVQCKHLCTTGQPNKSMKTSCTLHFSKNEE